MRIVRPTIVGALVLSAAMAAGPIAVPGQGAAAASRPGGTVLLVERGSKWTVRRGSRPPRAWWRSQRTGHTSSAPLAGRARWARTSFRIGPDDRFDAVVLRPHATPGVRVYVNGIPVGTDELPRRIALSRVVVGRTTVVVRLPRSGGRADPAIRARRSAPTPPSPNPVGYPAPPVTDTPTPTPTPEAPLDPQPRALCRVSDTRLPEISGMAASVRHPGIVWVHNDSGDTARVFALDTASCRIRAVVRLVGVAAQDFEGIAMGRDPGGTPELWVGDIGDNARSRDDVRLYRFREPGTLADADVRVTALRVTWTDGPRDCESLLVDPVPGGSVYLVSKEATGGLYRLAGDLRSGPLVTGRRLRDVRASASDAAIAPDRSFSVIRYYGSADVFPGVLAPEPVRRELPPQPQGEAITFSPDSRYLYLASEGTADLMRIPVTAP